MPVSTSDINSTTLKEETMYYIYTTILYARSSIQLQDDVGEYSVVLMQDLRNKK